MSYKTPRLLAEAIHKEMEELRKLLMSETTPQKVTDAGQTAIETLNVLRKLFDELAVMSERPTIDDVLKLSPGEYVATMKPLVARFHRQLMTIDLLAPALCEDLQATACVLILVGDGNTLVRTAHDPKREEVALVVETLLAAVDDGLKRIASDAAEAAGQMLDGAKPQGVIDGAE